MWAHYGENHKGVAIVFDKTKLINACKVVCKNNWAIANDNIKYKPHTLEYSFHIDEWQKILKKNEIDIAKEVITKYKKDYFCKYPEWSYENEYRILLYKKNEIDVNIKGCIKAVIFGEKTEGDVVNYFNKQNIDCYKVIFYTRPSLNPL
jgi:hypothetical protein